MRPIVGEAVNKVKINVKAEIKIKNEPKVEIALNARQP